MDFLENLIENIIEHAYRNCHQREIKVVVRASQMFQKSDAADIQQIGEGGNHQKTEYQSVVLVLKDQCAVRLEIEQDTHNGCQQIGNHVGIFQVKKIFENEKEHIID